MVIGTPERAITKHLYTKEHHTKVEISRELNVSRSTINRILADDEVHAEHRRKDRGMRRLKIGREIVEMIERERADNEEIRRMSWAELIEYYHLDCSAYTLRRAFGRRVCKGEGWKLGGR